MRKVIRQNTEIRDYDNLRIFKVVSVGDGSNGRTHCIEYDFDGNLVDDNAILVNHEITNIVYKNCNAKAVFRPEEDEEVYYKIAIRDKRYETIYWEKGYNLFELVSSLAYKLLFEDSDAMIQVGHFENHAFVTTYKTPWLSKDYVQEMDDYYSNPRHEYDTLEKCIEEVNETTSWV